MTPGRRRDCSCTIGDNDDDSDDIIDKHNDDYDDRRHDNKRRCVVPNYGGGVDMANMVGQQGGPPPHAFQMLQVAGSWDGELFFIVCLNIFSLLSG